MIILVQDNRYRVVASHTSQKRGGGANGYIRCNILDVEFWNIPDRTADLHR